MKEINNINQIQAAGPKIIVKVEKPQDKSKGGIFLTEKTRQAELDQASRGELIGIGETAFTEMMPNGNRPKIGDIVFFIKYAGREVVIDEQPYRFLNDEEVYAFEREVKV